MTINPRAETFLTPFRPQMWFDTVAAKVGITLLLLVFLAVPGFLLMVQNTRLILYYLIYPVTIAFGLYLASRGRTYLSSIVIVLSVYAVFGWMASLTGFTKISPLSWWILSLLPWVMFEIRRRVTVTVFCLLPIGFSFLMPFMPQGLSPLLPAEQDFIMQILRISVALGAFSCIYFLRRHLHESEKLRRLENEFYSNTLNAIPLPIILKDGITLDFIFFNQAAQLTYDLKPAIRNSNITTFSPSCAAQVSRLDQEVLRSVTYHIEPDENLVHQTGLHWHFRTYRIPLELKSSGRRLLVTVSEDLRALNLVTRKAQENKEMLSEFYRLLGPLLFHYVPAEEKIVIITPAEWRKHWDEITPQVVSYVEYHIPRHPATSTPQVVAFSLAERSFRLFYAQLPERTDISGMVTELNERH